MTHGALGIVFGFIALQVLMGIVAGNAGKVWIIGIVALRGKYPVRLKPHVVHRGTIRHFLNRARTAMAGAAKLLGECVGVERLGVKYVEVFVSSSLDGRHMPFSRSMACFATNTRHNFFKHKLVARYGDGAVTTKTASSFIRADGTTHRFFQSLWQVLGVPNGPIEIIDCGVEANPAFIEFTFVPEYIGLTSVTLSEGIQDGFDDFLLTI